MNRLMRGLRRTRRVKVYLRRNEVMNLRRNACANVLRISLAKPLLRLKLLILVHPTRPVRLRKCIGNNYE